MARTPYAVLDITPPDVVRDELGAYDVPPGQTKYEFVLTDEQVELLAQGVVHRHRWNRSEESAERDKVPVQDLDSVRTREQFLVRAFNVLRVVVDKSTDGEPAELQFD